VQPQQSQIPIELTPVHLNLKRDEQLEIEWKDGRKCVYSLTLLRTMCPCAQCRNTREGKERKKPLLTILPGNFSEPLRVVDAQLVGNYALKITWSDKHDTGIYSFQYLREICPGEG